MGNVNNFKRMNEIKYTSNYQLSPDQRIKLYSLISIEKKRKEKIKISTSLVSYTPTLHTPFLHLRYI